MLALFQSGADAQPSFVALGPRHGTGVAPCSPALPSAASPRRPRPWPWAPRCAGSLGAVAAGWAPLVCFGEAGHRLLAEAECCRSEVIPQTRAHARGRCARVHKLTHVCVLVLARITHTHTQLAVPGHHPHQRRGGREGHGQPAGRDHRHGEGLSWRQSNELRPNGGLW